MTGCWRTLAASLLVLLLVGCGAAAPAATLTAPAAGAAPAAPTSAPTAAPVEPTPTLSPEPALPPSGSPVLPLRITVVYDNTSYDVRLQQAWGFAVLIENRGHTLLFDTGGDPQILMNNLDLLSVDPQTIEAVALSHAHGDHVDGLPGPSARDTDPLLFILPSFPASFRNRYRDLAELAEVQPGQELSPGVFTTGQMRDPAVGIDEQSLVIPTARGLVIVTGCAHQGIVQVIEQAKAMFDAPVHLVFGGFHLVDKSAAQIEQIIAEFREMGVERAAPTHCTGEEAIARFAAAFGDDFVQVGAGRVLVIPEQASSICANGDLIAFVSTRDGNGEIYVMNVDGSNPRRLTNYRLWDGFPAWSPDGGRIAYYSYVSEKSWAIQVMNADGGNPRRLTESGACDGAPAWAPDGKWIAYSSDPDCTARKRDVVVVAPDGSDLRNLTDHDADDLSPAWSPDSQQMAFSSNRDGDYEIYLLDVDQRLAGRGADPVRLTVNDADDNMPAWSPDGSRLAFVSNRDGNDEIYLMAVDGSQVQRLTDDPASDWFPTWSPDGTQILFSRRDGTVDVYLMDADGRNLQRLTDHPADDFNAVWQPRGPGG